MGRPSLREARVFKDFLNWFMLASGVVINQHKSQLFFFNTPFLIQNRISRLLGFQRSSLPSKYLGGPLLDKPLIQANWEDLLAKLEARLSCWTHRSFNLASQLALVKYVLQSIPLYLLTVLATPKIILK